MPVIHLEFDDQKVSDAEALALSESVQKIVSKATGIEDVFVYGNSARIKVQIAPVEIFVQMSDHKIKDEKALVADIKTQLNAWKKEANYPHKINLTLTPMRWFIEIDV